MNFIATRPEESKQSVKYFDIRLNKSDVLSENICVLIELNTKDNLAHFLAEAMKRLLEIRSKILLKIKLGDVLTVSSNKDEVINRVVS